MTVMRKMRKSLVLSLALVIAITGSIMGGSVWTENAAKACIVQTGSFQFGFTAASSNDPPPNTIDPGHNKDVASCITELAVSEGNGDYEQVVVTISNAYPSYQCETYVTVHNNGSLLGRITSINITSPREITVTPGVNLLGVVVDPGKSADGSFRAHVEQSASQNTTYTFTIVLELTQWWMTYPGGTIGFWKNWDRNRTYLKGEIETWLSSIDSSSQWLGPVTIEGMEKVFVETSGKAAKPKFLGQYLATRLNWESGRFNPGVHNFLSYDRNNYLGLGGSGTVAQIIRAIESKYGTSPTEKQFEIMKNICDALNNSGANFSGGLNALELTENVDGKVDIVDITEVQRIIASLDTETPGADANQDGNINALDITKVERIIAGLDIG